MSAFLFPLHPQTCTIPTFTHITLTHTPPLDITAPGALTFEVYGSVTTGTVWVVAPIHRSQVPAVCHGKVLLTVMLTRIIERLVLC